MVTEGKQPIVDREEKKNLLTVMWSVAPKSKTQGPREVEWVRATRDVPVSATKGVELEI